MTCNVFGGTLNLALSIYLCLTVSRQFKARVVSTCVVLSNYWHATVPSRPSTMS